VLFFNKGRRVEVSIADNESLLSKLAG
jgi:hypothetical protein